MEEWIKIFLQRGGVAGRWWFQGTIKGVYMPSYPPPTFNIDVNIWRFGLAPLLTNPSVTSRANLCLGRRTNSPRVGGDDVGEQDGNMWLLLPKATDIRDGRSVAGSDTVEVPAWSQRFYSVDWVDDSGGGFANEHRFASLDAAIGWPEPYPPVGAIYPPRIIGGIPLAPLGNFQTLGIPANNLGNSVMMPGAGELYAFVTGLNNAGLPVETINPMSSVLGLSQVNLAGPFAMTTQLFTSGPIGAGLYMWNFAFPALSIGQLMISFFAVVPGVSVTNANNSNTFPGSIATCTSLFTTAAPGRVFSGASFIGNLGVPSWAPPVTNVNAPMFELVLGTQCCSIGGDQNAPVNAGYTAIATALPATNNNWLISLLK
jgi:hypothetical protein